MLVTLLNWGVAPVLKWSGQTVLFHRVYIRPRQKWHDRTACYAYDKYVGVDEPFHINTTGLLNTIFECNLGKTKFTSALPFLRYADCEHFVFASGPSALALKKSYL